MLDRPGLKILIWGVTLGAVAFTKVRRKAPAFRPMHYPHRFSEMAVPA